jgi:hypothetical protein
VMMAMMMPMIGIVLLFPPLAVCFVEKRYG